MRRLPPRGRHRVMAAKNRLLAQCLAAWEDTMGILGARMLWALLLSFHACPQGARLARPMPAL